MMKFNKVLMLIVTSISVFIGYNAQSYAQLLPNDPNFNNQPYLYNPNDRITDQMMVDESLYDIGFHNFFEFMNTHDMSQYKYRFDKEQIKEPVIAVLLKDFSITNGDFDLNKLYVNKNEVFENGKDDDNNGWIDDYYVTTILNKTKNTKDKPYYDVNHVSKEDALLSILLSKTDNNVDSSGLMLGGKLMLFDISNRDNKISMDLFNQAINYIYYLKHSGQVNIRGVLFPYNLTFANSQLKNIIKNNMRRLGSVGIVFVLPTYDPNYKNNFAVSEISAYNTINIPNPLYGLSDAEYECTLDFVSPQSYQLLSCSDNTDKIINVKYEGVATQDLCKFNLLNVLCATGINEDGTIQKDFDKQATNFVTGAYYKYRHNNREIILNDSSVSSAILAGMILNSYYLYPQLLSKDEITNISNIGSFLSSSSLGHSYLVEDLNYVEKQNIEELKQLLDLATVEAQSVMKQPIVQQCIADQSFSTSNTSTQSSNKNNNPILGGIFGNNSSQETTVSEESKKRSNPISNMISGITSGITNIFNRSRNKETEQYLPVDSINNLLALVSSGLENMNNMLADNNAVSDNQQNNENNPEITTINENNIITETTNNTNTDNTNNNSSNLQTGIGVESDGINTVDISLLFSIADPANQKQREVNAKLLKLASYGLTHEEKGEYNMFNSVKDIIANIAGNLEYIPDDIINININSLIYGNYSYPGIIYNNMEKSVN